jgi:HEAT repeat protein
MGIFTGFKLGSKDDAKRKEGIRDLAASRNPKHAKLLLRMIFNDWSWDVRREAATALGQLGSEEPLELLAAVVQSEAGDARDRAGHALRWIGKPALPFVLPLAQSHDPQVRYLAICALSEIADPSLAPLLGNEISVRVGNPWESTTGLRINAAIEGLKKIGGEAALRALIPHLLEDQAYKALDEIDPQWIKTAVAREGVRELVSGLKEGVQSERLARALGEIGDPSAVPVLIASIEVEGALLSLQRLDPEWRRRPEAAAKAQALAEQLAQESRAGRRGRMIEALGAVGDRSSLEGLIGWLPTEPEGDLRRKIVLALDAIGDLRIIEPLICQYLKAEAGSLSETSKALDALDPHWRGTAAARIAAQFESDRSCRRKFWEDFHGTSARVPQRDFSPPFLKMARSDDRHLRSWALCLLSEFDWELARDPVQSLLSGPALERWLATKLIDRFAPRGDALVSRADAGARSWPHSASSVFCFSCGKTLDLNLRELSPMEKDFYGDDFSPGFTETWVCPPCWDVLCERCSGSKPKRCAKCGEKLVSGPTEQTMTPLVHGLPLASLDPPAFKARAR